MCDFGSVTLVAWSYKPIRRSPPKFYLVISRHFSSFLVGRGVTRNDLSNVWVKEGNSGQLVQFSVEIVPKDKEDPIKDSAIFRPFQC